MDRVARLIMGAVLIGLLLCSMGCASHFAKGEGSLIETHTYIGRSPMSHQWGIDNPLDKDKLGPADAVAQHAIINPNIQHVNVQDSSYHTANAVVKPNRREARD